MSQLVEYFVKLSGTLMILYLFYWLVLSRLTFYTANRWYLLGYSMIAFLIPLINISPVLEQSQLSKHDVVQWIPVVQTSAPAGAGAVSGSSFQWNAGSIILLVFCSGAVLMLIRFAMQYFSIRSIRRDSQMISDGGVRIYQVDKDIIPFSFGNSIFINQHMHSQLELNDIIRHEFIHVKQKHTIDILWSELLCILNWYNPFVWLIRNAIRQNLEFIADNKVVENGIDRKQYQYLLLKVTGVPHYRIAPQFNFTSLKKRIAMMNKMRSAKVHFIKFLFVLPIMAVILLAYRNAEDSSDSTATTRTAAVATHVKHKAVADTVPAPSAPKPNAATRNSKGYFVTIADNDGECIVIIKSKENKIVKAVSLEEWEENEKDYKAQYGEIPPPPASSSRVIVRKLHPGKTDTDSSVLEVVGHKIPSPPLPSEPPQVVALTGNVSSVHVQNKLVTITLKSGESEKYDLSNPKDKAMFEKRYGKVNVSVDHGPRVVIDSLTISGEKPVRKDATIVIRPTPDVNKPEIQNKALNLPPDFMLVLDGKEYTQNVNDIVSKLDPNNIESMEVLKSETGKQLYGEKGKNGVIKIKTKADQR
jgi:hypothetical protein